jgi:hypothetical protein
MGNGVAKATAEAATIGEDQDAITARAKYVGGIDGTNMALVLNQALSMVMQLHTNSKLTFI